MYFIIHFNGSIPNNTQKVFLQFMVHSKPNNNQHLNQEIEPLQVIKARDPSNQCLLQHDHQPHLLDDE
jgi:hypothetical protein